MGLPTDFPPLTTTATTVAASASAATTVAASASAATTVATSASAATEAATAATVAPAASCMTITTGRVTSAATGWRATGPVGWCPTGLAGWRVWRAAGWRGCRTTCARAPMSHRDAGDLPELRGIGWLRVDYVATPAGSAWLNNLWCWGRRCSHWNYGRTVNRCLIAEQGYSAARWSAI